MQFLVDPNLKPYRIDLYSYAPQKGGPEIQVIDQNVQDKIDLRSTNFQYQGEIKFGSRDNNVRDDGGTKYYNLYVQNMQKPENAQRELKSIYFANRKEFSVSLFKLVIHKNAQLTQQPF